MDETLIWIGELMNLFFFFCGYKSPFCGATGALCFGLWLTLPVGFKARVDPSSPTLYSHLCVMILRVRVLLEWPPNVTSGITGRGRIRTQDLTAQNPTLYRLSYPGRLLNWWIFVSSSWGAWFHNLQCACILTRFHNCQSLGKWKSFTGFLIQWRIQN